MQHRKRRPVARSAEFVQGALGVSMNRLAARLVRGAISALDPRAVRNPGTRGRAHRLRSWWATNWRIVDPAVPSFMAALERQRRMIERPPAAELRALLSDKLRTFDLARSLGITVPEIIGAWGHPEQIDLTGAPERLCCKPVRATAGHGVLLLDRIASGWQDQHGLVRSQEDIRAYFAQLDLSEMPDRPLVYAEERLSAPAGQSLDDWKFYCFRGSIGLVLQVRRNRSALPRLRFWSPDFESHDRIRTPERCDLSLPPPVRPDALLAAARQLSAAIPLPFVRVDLYETTSGAVLGELSPAPGRIHLFPPMLDRYLGEQFERAEAELAFRPTQGRTQA